MFNCFKNKQKIKFLEETISDLENKITYFESALESKISSVDVNNKLIILEFDGAIGDSIDLKHHLEKSMKAIRKEGAKTCVIFCNSSKIINL